MAELYRIFLVEDDLEDQYFFKEALDTIQHAILMDIAQNGQDALDKLNALPLLPDIIFMDLNMPVMNGIDCIKHIKSTPQLQSVPVVILSTNVDSALAHSLAVNAYIKKPADIVELRNKVEQVLRLQFNPMDGTTNVQR